MPKPKLDRYGHPKTKLILLSNGVVIEEFLPSPYVAKIHYRMVGFILNGQFVRNHEWRPQ
jgi:hypothetical protein